MWNDQQDTEFFISCVKDRPALWDKDLEEYTNRGMRDKLWSDIAEIIFQEEWPQMDWKIKAEKVKEIKNRWRHMRDSYIKYLKGNNPNKRKRGYLHANSLQFIGDLMKRKKENDYNQSEEDEDIGGVDENSYIKIEPHFVTPEVNMVDEDFPSIQLSSENLLEPSLLDPSKSYSYDRTFKTFSSTSAFKPDLVNNAEPSTSSTSEQDEADKLFLMSILPDYKKLNVDEKIDFRIMVLQYFRDVRRKQNQEKSTTQQNLTPTDGKQ